MKRALILLSGAGASLYPILSCALGLGDLQVDSRLNQPLRAHIEISDVSEEEWRQIHARLAQQGESGLLRTTLDSIIFRTSADASHRHWVELSSTDPITEPLFDISVEVAGQTVQVIRDYSVFLDPPGRDEVGSRGVVVAGNGAAQGAGAAGAGAGTDAAESAARAATQNSGARGAARDGNSPGAAGGVTSRGAARSAASGRSAGGAGAAGGGARAGTNAAAGGAAGADANQQGGSAAQGAGSRDAARVGPNQQGLQAGAVYTVMQSDTLERIVRRLGGRTAAVRNQQMQWVFDHSPAAFYGSMDRLRAGAQLTLPGQSAVATSAPAAAANTKGAGTAEAATGSTAPVAPAVAKGSEAQPTSAGAPADERAMQAQLEGQVSTLQQTLTKLQETIAAQDAQIADLNRKIAGRAEQQRAERATSALAARIAPELASVADERPRVATSNSAAGSDTTVAQRPNWWARSTTFYWAGALGAAAILMVGFVMIRKRREAEEQYKPRYPLVEDSPFRYQATLESPPASAAAPIKQAAPPSPPPLRKPEPKVSKPSSAGLHVQESSAQESGVESWSTQTALLLSELPSADDTQPFMMGPHGDEVESEFENKRKPATASMEEPTARLQAMETHTVELQTTGELMTQEELEEAEMAGAPEHGWYGNSDNEPGQDGRDEHAANEPGPFDEDAGHAGRDRGASRGASSRRGRSERAGLSDGRQDRSDQGWAAGRGDNRKALDDELDDAGTVEIGSEELLAAEALSGSMDLEMPGTVVMNPSQRLAAQVSAAELRTDQTAANREIAEILEASLNYEPDRVDIKLKLLEIYHHQAVGNRDNFRALVNSLAKDSRLLSPVQRQHVETLQKTLNAGDQDADSGSVAEVAI